MTETDPHTLLSNPAYLRATYLQSTIRALIRHHDGMPESLAGGFEEKDQVRILFDVVTWQIAEHILAKGKDDFVLSIADPRFQHLWAGMTEELLKVTRCFRIEDAPGAEGPAKRFVFLSPYAAPTT